MIKRLFGTSLLIAALVLLLTPAALAAPKPAAKPANLLGIDISWPQCGKAVPNDQAFGIVGVNGGLATTTNACLKDQLVWANKSRGGTVQEKVQLYVNTANPGGLGTASWPNSNIDPSGATAPNPYGTCDGSDSLACAWQYGWNRSLEDIRDRFTPAATQAGMNSSAAAYIWWLDVETQNTWKTGGTTFDYQSNVADLEGMTAHLKQAGAKVGLYSTGAQWAQITGNAVSSSSNLVALPNWRPGGASQKTAQQACSAAPLTAGGKVVLTQFISRGIDYDVSCI